MIPMKTEDNSELISIGISSHPNFCRRRVRSMDDFLNHVEQVHPVITDLVKSGEVLDTNLMLDYRYEIKQAFSKDRWCIAGDAAFTVDPHCSVTDYLLASSNWSK